MGRVSAPGPTQGLDLAAEEKELRPQPNPPRRYRVSRRVRAAIGVLEYICGEYFCPVGRWRSDGRWRLHGGAFCGPDAEVAGAPELVARLRL
eukprot:6194297-Lingulodinium_polyedra.AAC.1